MADTGREPNPAPDFMALRRDIHQHPELGYSEHRTSALAADCLREWGYQVETGIGKTGLVATLVRGSGQRRLGIRADMDALPIQERTGLPWASACAGVMHACGHDGHTATLLSAAWHIAHDVEFDGTLHLIFQPAEEGGGGARAMIEDGLFERFPCDAVFALHNMPGIEQGRLQFREGPALASADQITIALRGTGGHGAIPHKANDPVVAAAALVMSLQTVVSRNVDPLQSGVVTVGSIQAGQAANVIPGEAVLKVSVRALDRAVRTMLLERIETLTKGHAQSFGMEAQVSQVPSECYPVLVNTPIATDFARRVAVELLGESKVECAAPLMASEDFAFMLDKIPGCYFFIGNGDGGDGNMHGACMVHNAGYDFNDANIEVGSRYWVLLVQRFFGDARFNPEPSGQP